MVIFKKNLKAKSEPDIHQNVPNCTCPETPYQNTMICAEWDVYNMDLRSWGSVICPPKWYIVMHTLIRFCL